MHTEPHDEATDQASDQASTGTGPLSGIRVLELAALGPAPFGGMILADLGATVIRIDRPSDRQSRGGAIGEVMGRGKHSIAVDLKQPEGVALVLEMCADADALIEGFRPGVTERLGVGPDVCHERNPALVYGRMTGWGQDGPLAAAPGHDINYISIGGALGAIGRADQPPTPPLNLVGDFGGGGMLLAVGVLSALLSAKTTGQGQVVDAAMVDGTALLMAPLLGSMQGHWGGRGTSILDSGAHFYDVYETSDGGYVSVGALEPQFYAELLARMGIDRESMPRQMDSTGWPDAKRRLADTFRTKSRDEWCALLEGTNACVSPVLEPPEVEQHPHNVARGMFVEVDGVRQARPAPRFDRTDATIAWGPPGVGEHTDRILTELGRSADDIAALRSRSIVA